MATIPPLVPPGLPVEGFYTITLRSQTSSASTSVPEPNPSNSVISEARDISSASTANASQKMNERGQETQNPSTGIKITIALSVLIGVLVLVAILAWHVRTMAQARNKKRLNHSIKPVDFPGPTESSTPLVSPGGGSGTWNSEPQTPPPRLRERRLLLPRVLSRKARQKGGEYDWGGGALPSLPPTRTALGSNADISSNNHELRELTRASFPISPLRLCSDDHQFGNSFPSMLSTSSTIQPASLSISSSAVTETTPNRLSGTTVTAEVPQRPPPVYIAPPVVGGLASPGPPPNRALPSTPSPSDGRVSPLKSPLLSPGLTIPPRRVARAVPLESTSPTPSQRKNYALEVRDEGLRGSNHIADGFIQCNGAGGTGSREYPISPRRARHVRSPLLKEADGA